MRVLNIENKWKRERCMCVHFNCELIYIWWANDVCLRLLSINFHEIKKETINVLTWS
jgi:hypothetical protein